MDAERVGSRERLGDCPQIQRWRSPLRWRRAKGISRIEPVPGIPGNLVTGVEVFQCAASERHRVAAEVTIGCRSRPRIDRRRRP